MGYSWLFKEIYHGLLGFPAHRLSVYVLQWYLIMQIELNKYLRNNSLKDALNFKDKWVQLLEEWINPFLIWVREIAVFTFNLILFGPRKYKLHLKDSS